jgi:hypothetical protein
MVAVAAEAAAAVTLRGKLEITATAVGQAATVTAKVASDGFVVPLLQVRLGPARLPVERPRPERWWVLGGNDNVGKPVVSTDMYSFAGGFARGVNLPREGRANCAMKMNSTHVLLLGGEDSDRRFWLVDTYTASWTDTGVMAPPGFGEGAHCGPVRTRCHPR